ncbi:hypothetical protein [Aeromicrobium fastidiosum]|uniref:Uncharacterized protein n=1 Tax=Aeromicrobium fastidiosum TaxID=52699 RepID=A0A641AP11_9ACTN|nr:hypothetical protein [Aeromicrobium fastidiosum]KAA1376532.1 hypothetical protein ESP62_014005 [Aeromicrobium fastidiosum]MBP2391550.1 hypothetical protein [Aeromicrobium fastidiosum]
MTSAPVVIPGVAGPVTAEYSFWSGYTFVVDGRRVSSRNRMQRNRVTLPGTSGPVEATIKGALGYLQAHPTLVVDGAGYPMGPATPVVLKILSALPVLLVLGGLLGGVAGAAAMATNATFVRRTWPAGVKAALMIGMFAAAAGLYVGAVRVLL